MKAKIGQVLEFDAATDYLVSLLSKCDGGVIADCINLAARARVSSGTQTGEPIFFAEGRDGQEVVLVADRRTMFPMGRGGNASLVVETNFREFVASGLASCWLSGDPDDVNANCSFVRPLTADDVIELRGYFLDTLETLIVGLWKRVWTPGMGWVDSDTQQTLTIDTDDGESFDSDLAQWSVRLDKDAIMMELGVSGTDPDILWLDYRAIKCRKKVVEVLREARQYVTDGRVYDKLTALVK